MNKLFKSGELFVWLTGAFLGISIIMICGMLLLIGMNGASYFYPEKIHYVSFRDEQGENAVALGQIYASEPIPADVMKMHEYLAQSDPKRYLVRVGNRDVFGEDFRWMNGPDIQVDSLILNAVCLERREYGLAYGIITGLKTGQEVLDNEVDAWRAFQRAHPRVLSLQRRIYEIEKKEIGSINYSIEKLRLVLKKYDYDLRKGAITSDEFSSEKTRIEQTIASIETRYGEKQRRADSLKSILADNELTLRVVGKGGEEPMRIPLAAIVRAYKPNIMSFGDKVTFYADKIWEFLSEDPREANSEGGVFPAIFGTVMMVLIMSLAAVPFGVLAALYLREYAKQGVLVRTVRIAVNNLAGVPSIVFGMFGLGFFVYFIGGGIDQLFYPERLPNPTYGTGGILWASLTLALLTVPVVIVATEEALAAIPRGMREGSYALGATKWDTIRRVIIPSATPGIMTGTILAMARGAGEVAPLMITGVVKLATEMPFDGNFPFFHLDRKFMHLGFHIYDVGFQTSNVEANIAMVYTTTLLLIFIILLLNLAAIIIRAKLRKKYRLAGF